MEFVQQNIMWIAVAVISGGMLLWQTVRGGGAGVSPFEATQLINREDAIVVDVREPHEYAAGHLPNAKHIPVGQFGQRVGELERFKGKPVIVVCHSGNRSSAACSALENGGFEKVYNLAGGIAAWEQAGMPVTKK